jgi:hypothetical protein
MPVASVAAGLIISRFTARFLTAGVEPEADGRRRRRVLLAAPQSNKVCDGIVTSLFDHCLAGP